MFIKKHWKEILILSVLFITGLIILLVITISNQKLREAEKSTENNLLRFNVLAGWKGTNGEVIKALSVEGTNLYAACGYDGFYVFDFITLDKTASYTNEYSINDIYVKSGLSNTLVFLAVGGFNNQGGLLICSSTDISNISIINSAVTNDQDAESLYVVMSNERLFNIFITDDKKGYRRYTYEPDKNTLYLKNEGAASAFSGVDITANQNIVSVVSREGITFIYDWNGVQLSRVSNSLSMADDISLYSNILAVADRMNGITLYDTANPKKLRSLGNYNTPGDAFGVLKEGEKIFIADGINGVLNVKQDKSAAFILEKQYNDGALYNKLYYLASNDTLYAGCGKDGVKILK